MSEFTSLKLDREKIDEAIKNCFEGCTITSKRENTKNKTEESKYREYTYLVDIEGSQAMLNIYHNGDGTTSLHHKLGKKQDLSLKLAESIKNFCKLPDLGVSSFYIKKIDAPDLETIYDFLRERGAKIDDEVNVPNGVKRTVTGKQGDHLVFTYFNNHALQVQGKPVLLMLDTVEIMCELLPFKEVIEQQLNYYSVNLTAGNIIGEMEARIPTAYAALPDKIKSIISPAIALRKVKDLELPDFSSFAFPVLRGIEGIVKQLLAPKFIVTQDGFGTFFDSVGPSSVLKPEVKTALNDRVKCACIEKLYNYYKVQRHSLFHADVILANIRLIDRREAENIINTSLNMIEEVYVDLNS